MANSDSEKERDIIARLKNDDERAIILIFKLYHKSFFYLARQIVRNDEQAEDIVSECFFRLWKKRGDFHNLESIRTFMNVIIRNASIDYVRHVRRKSSSHEEIRQQSETDSNYLETKMIKTDLLQLILQEVESLPPMRKKIFKLIFLDDLSVFEIARILNISVDTVRVQKAKALHGLRSAILKKGFLLFSSQVSIALHFCIFLN